LMPGMLLAGADGIVPSVGNLAPELCHQLFAIASTGDRAEAERLGKRMLETAMLYQRDRTLSQSLVALKVAMSMKGLCAPTMWPPLRTLDEKGHETIRQEMLRLGMLANQLYST
jgi:dihydrodipicolinate synthase/N-acetylneuraminate lyase